MNEPKNDDIKSVNSYNSTLHLFPKPSKWKCYLFGGTQFSGMTWRPAEGEHPNWFWRLMQFLVFGNRWSKDI